MIFGLGTEPVFVRAALQRAAGFPVSVSNFCDGGVSIFANNRANG